MKYKLLALDIDGTLVEKHTNIVSKRVAEAIKKVKQKLHVSLVSARAWNDQRIIVDSLGLVDCYHVVENGTKVINPAGTLEYSKHIPPHEVQQIIKTTSHLHHEAGLCIDGMWKQKHELEKNHGVSTISLISPSRKHAQQIPQILESLPQTYHVTIGSHWTNPAWAVTLISHRNASKGAGLHFIQNKLRITSDETIAVGDGASDISTMQYASVKVAMGNAEPELKHIATYIAPLVSENGLVDVINKFIL